MSTATENQFSGRCTTCSKVVAAYKGLAFRGASGKWAVMHYGCGTPCYLCGGKTSSRSSEVLCRKCCDAFRQTQEYADLLDLSELGRNGFNGDGQALLLGAKSWADRIRAQRAEKAPLESGRGVCVDCGREEDICHAGCCEPCAERRAA